MNDTTIYLGSYLAVKMPKEERFAGFKCPRCSFHRNITGFCQEHGIKLEPYTQTDMLHPGDFLLEEFQDEDLFSFELWDDDRWLFLPNHKRQGGLYINMGNDYFFDIPEVSVLKEDWVKLMSALTEKEIPYEVKYGGVVVSEK